MNYQFFIDVEAEKEVRGEQESDQAFMERVFRTVIEGGVPNDPPDVNDWMAAEFVSCDAEKEEFCLRFHVEPMMLNPNGHLHGGIMTTALDITMGMLTRFLFLSNRPVTVELNTNYLRGVQNGATYVTRAHVTKSGRNLKFLYCEAFDEETGKRYADGTGVFMLPM